MKQKLTSALVYATPISWWPVGLGMMGAVLEENGCEVHTLVNNFRNYKDSKEILAWILEREPDIVGFSFMTFGVNQHYELAKAIKKISPDTLVVSGGNHPTLFPEESIHNGFDITVIGEGEKPLEGVVQYLNDPTQYPLDNIKGLGFLDSTGIYKTTGPADIIQELDDLPFPARHLFDPDEFRSSDGELKGYGSLIGTRGCPFQCTFCSTSAFGPRYRRRTPRNVIDEIVHVKETYGTDTFTFVDDQFFLKKSQIHEICNELIERKANIRWNCGCRTELVSDENLKAMKKSGCFQINFGIESGDKDTLKKIKKGNTTEDALNAVRLTKENGIKVYANFMTGFPWETAQQILNTEKFIRKLRPWTDRFSNSGVLIPVPGTDIYEELRKEYDIEEYWLRPEYQNIGTSIYQNVNNPFEVSNWFQRDMYDDSFVQHEYFFKYRKDQKDAMFKLMFTIGVSNIYLEEGRSLRGFVRIGLGYLSHLANTIHPSIEKYLTAILLTKNASSIHDMYGVGYKKNDNRQNALV